MPVRNKLLFLICLSHLFNAPVPLHDRSLKGSPIFSIFPVDPFLNYDSRDMLKDGIPPMFQDKLDMKRQPRTLKSTISSSEFLKINSFLDEQIKNIRLSPEYSRLPKLSISLKPQLEQLDRFFFEAKQLRKDEKADKYATIKPTLDQIIAKVNEAIQEAIKETVYSSKYIESAYAKLVQIGDLMGLGLSEELSQEIIFDSKRLESDGRQDLYYTLIELRNALARDEDLMTPLIEVRNRLGTVYRISFPDYERARTEAYYVLKLVRKKMGWNEGHLEQAIKDTKRLMEEMYQIPINDWKDIIPVIPGAHIKGLRFQINEDDIVTDEAKQKLKRLLPNEPYSSLDLSYKEGVLETFNLEDSLKLEWVRLCEIFETVYEKKPTEKSEELYRLLCALGDFELINESRQFLFFPWFNPKTYTRRCRFIHAGLHLFKSALYAPQGKSFGLDIMHSIGEHMQDSKKKEIPQMSILDEATMMLYNKALCSINLDPCFFNFSDRDIKYAGLAQFYRLYDESMRSHLSLYRSTEFCELAIAKKMMREHELPILKKMENHEIALMLETLEYRYDITQLSFLRRALYAPKSSSSSGGSTCSNGSLSSDEEVDSDV